MSGVLPGPPGASPNSPYRSQAQGRHPTVPATPEVILEENALLLGELDGSLSSLTMLGSGMAGSIGVALAATRISGLMPFGPAFQSGQLEVGDEVMAIDGVEVTSGTVVNAMTGEQESDIQIQVRKPNGEIRLIDLVRTSSAKLLIAHNLAQHLHTLYKNFDTSTSPTGETDFIKFPDIELQRIVSTCIGLLQDLQDQVSRTEASGRNRLRQAQQKMFVQIKQLQDSQHRLRESVSRTSASSQQLQEAIAAKEKAVSERDQTMSHLMSSQEVLNVLEPQLARTLTSLAEKQQSLEAAASERRGLNEQIERLTLQLELADARQRELERFAGDVSREKMSDQEKMLQERLRSLEQHQARVADLEQQAAELEAENQHLTKALQESGLGHPGGASQQEVADIEIVAKLHQEIGELKKDLRIKSAMSTEQLTGNVLRSACTDKLASQDQLIKELSASPQTRAAPPPPPPQNGGESVDHGQELEKAKILNSVYEERLREQTRELQAARSLAAEREEQLKTEQEIQHRKESEALLTANADLVELRALLAAIEPQAVRLKMLEEENAELRKQQELAKKKEASYVSKIGEMDRERTPAINSQPEAFNTNTMPAANNAPAAPLPAPEASPSLPPDAAAAVPVAIASLASVAPPRPLAPPAPRTSVAPPPLSPTLVPRTRPDQAPSHLRAHHVKVDPPRPPILPNATRSPPQPAASGPSVWATAAKNFERSGSPPRAPAKQAAPPPPPPNRNQAPAPYRGAPSSSWSRTRSPPEGQGRVSPPEGQAQSRSVYSANAMSASSIRPSLSLPGSRSASPSHSLSSGMMGPGMVLYSSNNSDGYLTVNQQVSNGPYPSMMHPGQAYLPNMSTRPTYAGPAAARDKTAAWVQSLQHQNGNVVAVSRGNLR